MSDLIRREEVARAVRLLSEVFIDGGSPTAAVVLNIAMDHINALPAVQSDDDLVGHMTKLIAAGLDRIEQLTAERDRLREALDGLLTSVEHADFEDGWCCCGDDMLHHQSPMDCGHTPVDMGEYHASLAIKEARAALKGDSHE